MAKQIVLVLLAAFVLAYTIAPAQPTRPHWTGSAYAPDREEARSQALRDLAGNLRSDVRSSYFEQVNNDLQNVQLVFSISVNLPLLNPEVQLRQERTHNFLAEATLFQERSLPLYMSEMERIADDITAALAVISANLDIAGTASLRESMWQNIIGLLDDFDRHRIVALVLGGDRNLFPGLATSKAEAQQSLFALSGYADSFARAAELLTKDLDQARIFVQPARAQGNNIPTPFARMLAEHMNARLQTVANPEQAQYVMLGYYDFCDQWIDVVYHLREAGTGSSIASRTLRISIAGLNGPDHKPVAEQFEQWLQRDAIVPNQLRVQLYTSRGDENLAFGEGEEIELFIRASHPASFYLVNYINKGGEAAFAQLLPLNAASHHDPRYQFLAEIPAENVNRRISLGRFAVTGPFGVESLQVVAMRDRNLRDAVRFVPPFTYNQRTGLFEISEGDVRASMQQAVVQSRALRLVPNPPEVAESNLLFVTFPR